MRAGTSRGPFFLREWLPKGDAARNQALIGAIGASDPLQLDGLGGGSTPISDPRVGRAGYRHHLDMMRRALRECCGYTADVTKEFGLQSLRRGGDTALFESGATQEQRQLLGMWRTADVELSYIGFDARQHLRWAQALAV